MAIVIDIETLAKPIPQVFRDTHRAKLERRYKKADTIEEHMEKFLDSFKFTPAGCEIICVAVWDTDVWQGEYFTGPGRVSNFCKYLNNDKTEKLVGFNIKQFDLPILLRAMAAEDCKLDYKFSTYDIVDLMEIASKYGVSGSLDEVLLQFDLPMKTNHGSNVAAMHEEDMKDGGTRVAKYCLDDVKAEALLYKTFNRMFNL